MNFNLIALYYTIIKFLILFINQLFSVYIFFIYSDYSLLLIDNRYSGKKGWQNTFILKILKIIIY